MERARPTRAISLALLAVVAVIAAGCVPVASHTPGPDDTGAYEHRATQPDDATARCQQFGCSL